MTNAAVLRFPSRANDAPRPPHLIRVAVPRLNKCDWISEYLKQLDARDYDLEWAEVTETRVLSCAEWNILMGSLLEDRDWLSGKGGTSSWTGPNDTREFFQLSHDEQEQWKRGAYMHVVAVQCAGETIYIDPQGYDYARYVAFKADAMDEGKTREELRREQAKAECARLQAEKLARVANEIANPPAVPVDHGLRFLWNGIKVKGELYRCWYSLGNLTNYPQDTVSVSARDYKSFPAEVRTCFHVENNTEIQSDYFDSDRLRVVSAHPLYALARAAYDAQEAHHARRMQKRGLTTTLQARSGS